MKEHPILMSAPMIRALLAGTKTQTRRLVTWQGPKSHPHYFDRAFTDNPAGVRRLCVPHHHPQDADAGRDERGNLNPCHRHYPRWEKGDRLWVKETWARRLDEDHLRASQLTGHWAWYWADPQTANTGCAGAAGKRRPSIFMPRRASRITLTVTEEPTPQRLQDITEEDAGAEGIVPVGDGWGIAGGKSYRNARNAYRALWTEINGIYEPKGWDFNPWVWRIAFARLP